MLAEAEEYGASANASAGQICELVTPVAGVGRVSNPMGRLTSAGASEETDEQLHEGYALQWLSIRTVKRARRLFADIQRLYGMGSVDISCIAPRVASFTGYMQHCDGYQTLDRILDRFVLLRGGGMEEKRGGREIWQK